MMAIPLSFQKLNEGKAHSYQAFLKFQTSPCVLALNKAYIVFEVSLCNYQSDLMWRETILVSRQSLDLRQHISSLCSQCSQVTTPGAFLPLGSVKPLNHCHTQLLTFFLSNQVFVKRSPNNTETNMDYGKFYPQNNQPCS